MKELVFALQFKGKAHPVEGVEGKLAAKTTAAGQVLRTTLAPKGVQAKAESKPGPRATFESEVQMTGPSTFIESGRIRQGRRGDVQDGWPWCAWGQWGRRPSAGCGDLGSDRGPRSVRTGHGAHYLQLHGRVQGRDRRQSLRSPIPTRVTGCQRTLKTAKGLGLTIPHSV
jgi:hypothetical protein